MFYKNLKKHKQTSEKNLIFSIFDDGVLSDKDDSITKPNQCKDFYNLSFCDGALKTGLGFSEIQVPSSADDLENTHVYSMPSKITKIEDIYFEKTFSSTMNDYVNEILVLNSDFKLYSLPMIDPYGYMETRCNVLTAKPIYVAQYRADTQDISVIFTKKEAAMCGALINGVLQNVPILKSCVVHYGNFFGIKDSEKNELIYTKNTDLRTWKEGETVSKIAFLDNRGAFIKLVAFNDYVYLFREKGITRISIYTSKDDFSFTHLYTSSARIFEKTICVCGDKVFFMTRDGLYSFNGTSVTKICENYDKYFKKLDNSNCSCACLDGKYYLSTKCDFDDGEVVGCEANESYKNNALFQIDIKNFDINILRGVDINSIVSVDCPYYSKLCACFNDQTLKVGQLEFGGKYFGSNTEKSWKSTLTDLGYKSKRKKVKEIVLTSKYDCEVEIISDEETKKYSVIGTDVEQKISASVLGNNFQFRFKTNVQKCDIIKPMVIFDVVL